MFKHHELRLVEPAFGSTLTDLIIELDHLRKKRLAGTTHPRIFFQLKNIFHTLESIASARIEGNRTTIAEFIESKLEDKANPDEKIIEIRNMEKAMDFIDKQIDSHPINRAFVSELHKIVAAGLSPDKEGDATPGAYRSQNVKITNAAHTPPDVSQVQSYMETLFSFIAQKHPSKYDLLKTAIAHHRFVWVHPFKNGNGRTVRLFTYAMLVHQGFNIKKGRIVNPAAVFCADRDKYYEYLAKADEGSDQAILLWCEYVLSGLKGEIEKIDRLLDYGYLSEKILLPAIDVSLDRKIIIDSEAKILKIAIHKQKFKAGDLTELFPGKHASEISRMLRLLKEKKMIVPDSPEARSYFISFHNNYLLRGVITMLGKNGFLPVKDR